MRYAADNRSEEQYKSDIERGWKLEDQLINDINQALPTLWYLYSASFDSDRIFRQKGESLNSQPDFVLCFDEYEIQSIELKVSRYKPRRFGIKQSNIQAMSDSDSFLIVFQDTGEFSLVSKAQVLAITDETKPHPGMGNKFCCFFNTSELPIYPLAQLSSRLVA